MLVASTQDDRNKEEAGQDKSIAKYIPFKNRRT